LRGRGGALRLRRVLVLHLSSLHLSSLHLSALTRLVIARRPRRVAEGEDRSHRERDEPHHPRPLHPPHDPPPFLVKCRTLFERASCSHVVRAASASIHDTERSKSHAGAVVKGKRVNVWVTSRRRSLG